MAVSNIQSGVIEIASTISTDRHLNQSCVLKLEKPGSFLRMKAKRNNKQKGEGITSLIDLSCLLLG